MLVRITQEADYGLRIVSFLADQSLNQRYEAKIVASQMQIPLRFTLKIMRKLCRAGILNSFRGVGGGYSIAKDLADISIKEIIEVIDGDIAINRCLEEENNCTRLGDERCVISKHLLAAQELMAEKLESATFDKIKKEKK